MSSVFRASGLIAAAIGLALSTGGCATHVPPMPDNASVGAALPASWPSPATISGAAPPTIVAAHFSSLDVKRGEVWSGSFVTGTNAASLEVRTNLFSIDVPRTAYGRFAFDVDLYDTPPIFVRPYRLRVIARNTAGEETEEDLPFEIR